MSWIDRVLGRKSATLDQLPGFLMIPESKSGVAVNYFTALQVTAVLACCRALGQGIAQVPCKLKRPRKGGGADDAIDHPLFRMLYLKPNALGQTSFEFWETLILHLALVGNAFVYKSQGDGGRIIELILLEPGQVSITQNPDRSLTYRVTSPDGSQRLMPPGAIWHVRGTSWNGWLGMEVVKLAREAIGLSLSLEEAHSRLHQNGVQPSGIYSVEGVLTEEQNKKLTAWIKAKAGGASRGAPLILDHSAKWLAQQMTGVDAQHLETRRMQVEEICRAMNVMPIMVGLSEKTATYASAEQMFLQHVVHTLSPLANRLEQSAAVGLFTEEDDTAGLYLKFHLQALMRGDYKSRQEGLNIMRRAGVINANEWRAYEDMNPRTDPGGEQYIVEANMAIQDGRDLPTPKAPVAAA